MVSDSLRIVLGSAPLGAGRPAVAVAGDRGMAGAYFNVPSLWSMTPRQSIEAECKRRGRAAVVDGCAGRLEGRDIDDELLLALGGPAAEYVLSGGEGGKGGYWPRVWAARGLLHVWDETAAPAIIQATGDESWRVREMAAKVIARHGSGDALDSVLKGRDDPVARVRAAAERAVQSLTARRA
jgi:hypothetical protein